MKQVVLSGGAPKVVQMPAPSPESGRVLVALCASVISSGTERAAVTGGGPLPVRALRNPELIGRALEHLRERGLRETFDLARGVTAPDLPLGYSAAGVVLDTGGVPTFRVGQLVACAGAGSANHAEVVSVPGNLVAAVPVGVTPKAAAFTTLGAIALQGVRRAQPTIGEQVVVVGLGLLGLIAVQLLRANGCRVLGVEPNPSRRELGRGLGAELAVEPSAAGDAVATWTGGGGADGVLIMAASSSDVLINDAIAMVRRKGRVVPVGDVGLGLSRDALYAREADVLISTSYGPGRYDPLYEDAGIDYPPAYVRWTENRNMQAFLELLRSGEVRVEPLIEIERPVEQAADLYAALGGSDPPLAAVLVYGSSEALNKAPEVVRVSRPDLVLDRMIAARRQPSTARLCVALIGAGSFVRGVHIPNLKRDRRVRVVAVANRSGTSASDAARLVGGADTSTDWRAVIARDDIDLVVIGTRHDSHAEIAAAALTAGKAVFVEKPLGLSRTEIDSVWAAAQTNDRLAVGFNRPFAPLSLQLRQEMDEIDAGCVHLIYRVCSPLPHDHWLNDPAIGGGRVLGEACHMYDFANWLCGSPTRVHATALPTSRELRAVETSSVTIEYVNGSLATVHYSGVGAASMPKERIEVLRGGRSWVLDDFTTLISYGADGPHTTTNRPTDKGHARLMTDVVTASLGERPFEPSIGAAYAAQSIALAALEAMATASPQQVSLCPNLSPQ